MTDNGNPSDVPTTDAGKNKHSVVCVTCQCVILRPSAASFLRKEKGVMLPYMKQAKKNDGEKQQFEGDEHTDFWVVSDMFSFENVGFCNTVDDIKYLACADCEIGPIGAHKLNTKEFLVALKRTELKME